MPVATQASIQQEQNLDYRAALLGETVDGVTIEEAREQHEIDDGDIDPSVRVIGSEKELEAQRQQLEEEQEVAGLKDKPIEQQGQRNQKKTEAKEQSKQKGPADIQPKARDIRQRGAEAKKGTRIDEDSKQQAQGWKDFVLEKGAVLTDTVRGAVREKGLLGASLELKDVALEKGFELKDVAFEKGTQIRNAALDRTAHLKDTALEYRDVAWGKGAEIKDSVLEKGVIKTGLGMKDAALEKTALLKDVAIENGTDFKDAALERVGFKRAERDTYNSDESESSNQYNKSSTQSSLLGLKDAMKGLKDSMMENSVVKTGIELRDIALEATTVMKDLVVDMGMHLTEAVPGTQSAIDQGLHLKETIIGQSSHLKDVVLEKGIDAIVDTKKFATDKASVAFDMANNVTTTAYSTLNSVKEAVWGMKDEENASTSNTTSFTAPNEHKVYNRL